MRQYVTEWYIKPTVYIMFLCTYALARVSHACTTHRAFLDESQVTATKIEQFTWCFTVYRVRNIFTVRRTSISVIMENLLYNKKKIDMNNCMEQQPRRSHLSFWSSKLTFQQKVQAFWQLYCFSVNNIIKIPFRLQIQTK